MKSSVKKADIVNKVAESCDMKKKEAEAVVTCVLDSIVDAVAKGDRVHLSGFGIFDVRVRKAREGINPRSQEPMFIEESYVPTFKAGKSFKEKVAASEKIKDAVEAE